MAVEDFEQHYRRLEKLVAEIKPVPRRLFKQAAVRVSLRTRAKQLVLRAKELVHGHTVLVPLGILGIIVAAIFGIRRSGGKTS